MNCPQCSRQIPDTSKFCPECGHPLAAASTLPRQEKDRSDLLQNYIPPELAKRILSVGKQIESERRLVTILFADVSGFTAMSEKLDPEVVTTVLNDCFKGLISIVYKYEGVIDKFIGDEIMAIFGAPIAHENDAERGVRCAMEMQEYIARFNTLSPVALPVPLGMHIGLNTGIVVAGNVGSDLRMNYSVVGDTVNLASRLEHVAVKGEVVISDETYRVVSSLVNVENPRIVEVKGKSEPVKTYKVLSVRSEVQPGTRVLRESPIVGRQVEIAALKAACDQVVAKKEQRVFIRGEAGVGKSRLKLELIRLAKEAGIATYEGKCSSFELNTPYYLWTTLLKSILTLGPDAGESETRKHLHDILQILSLEKHEPYLATLLSLRYEEILMEEDQDRKRRIYEGVRELVRALAGRRLSIFLFEDVHWIDRFSQELLAYLFAEESLAPAMFVPIFRDEYTHWKALMERGGELVDLNRLSTPDASRLMSLRLAVDDVPANLADVIYRRSEGNPFFIEELIKTLLDKNLVSVKKRRLEVVQADFENVLPGTVQGVIMARIDRLEERLREVLFGASVIGREFSTKLLKEILKQGEMVDPSLHDLISLELVLEQEEAKEFAYLFKHYLIQEVAYNTILQKKRKELHALIAKAIEKLYADKLKEFYELLAFHYERAEEWQKAADYLSRAGRKVGEIFSKDESNAFVERKEAAIQKLYEAASEKRLGWIVLGVATAVLLLPFAAAMLAMPFFIGYMVWMLPPYIEFSLFGSEILGTIGFYLYVTILFLIYPWIGLLFVYFGILPAFKGRPKLFDITDDSVRVLSRSAKSITISFAEIRDIMFFDPQMKKTRSLSDKILDPFFRLAGAQKFTVGLWFREVVTNVLPPYSFGFGSKEGEIQIGRWKGANRRRLLMPWLNSPRRARVISISPANPKEFYEQLQVAMAKWKRDHK
jgi:class 3 adenylate cyclase